MLLADVQHTDPISVPKILRVMTFGMGCSVNW